MSFHQKDLYNISEAAKFLNVSIDTLRRWDKSGKLVASRKGGGTHRYYKKEDLDLFSSDLFALAKNWAMSGGNISSGFYCEYSITFQTRLLKMQEDLMASKKYDKILSLIVAIIGEIGNNSYDHNLGNWPDISGIFFGYDLNKNTFVLADRGLGIFKTLKQVRSSLTSHQEALQVAFTEIISGRAPENRGNGLKFVRKVVQKNNLDLFFQSGDAEAVIHDGQELSINKSETNIQGCLVKIKI